MPTGRGVEKVGENFPLAKVINFGKVFLFSIRIIFFTTFVVP